VSAELGSRSRILSSTELRVTVSTSNIMLFRAVRNLLGSRPNAHTIETHNNARVLLNLTGPARQKTLVAAKPTRDVWTTVGHREPKEERTPGSSEFKFHLTKTIK